MKQSDVKAIWKDMTRDTRNTGDIQFSTFERAVDGVVGIEPPSEMPAQPLDYSSSNKSIDWD